MESQRQRKRSERDPAPWAHLPRHPLLWLRDSLHSPWKSAAHRDKSREWARLKAKVEPLSTLGDSGFRGSECSLMPSQERSWARQPSHTLTPTHPHTLTHSHTHIAEGGEATVSQSHTLTPAHSPSFSHTNTLNMAEESEATTRASHLSGGVLPEKLAPRRAMW